MIIVAESGQNIDGKAISWFLLKVMRLQTKIGTITTIHWIQVQFENIMFMRMENDYCRTNQKTIDYHPIGKNSFFSPITSYLYSLLFLLFSSSVFGQDNDTYINETGKTITTRFTPPAEYERVISPAGSFGAYLQSLPLKPHGTPVKYYNGEIKNRPVYCAVVDMEIGKQDLQQCADAVMRLRAEHLYQQKKYADIHFKFTNGDNAPYTQYAEGYRASVKGNKITWNKTAKKDYSYPTFRKYMDLVFMYAGTLSLSKELKPVASLKDIQIGDVFIKGGSPGHAVIVVDMAQNKKTGEKLFLLAQSYMPAQETQVLLSPMNGDLSPWYSNRFEGNLQTPEWTFEQAQLKRFAEK